MMIGSECNCGTRELPPRGRGRNRIFGGATSIPHEYPWVVAIKRYKRNGNLGICGGSLISNQHVLTAAHCTDDGTKAEQVESIHVNVDGFKTTFPSF